MANLFTRLLIVLLALFHLAAPNCQGTETGNPGSPSTKTEGNSYSNKDRGVSTEYPKEWSVTEQSVPSRASAPPSGPSAPSPMTGEKIDTSNSPSTILGDGTTSVTLFYVTLTPEPSSLLTYLQTQFPSRAFREISNGRLTGYFYDNPEPGETGGDRIEYYFLNKNRLLYVVTDLFGKNNGIEKFSIILTALRFE